MYKIVIIISFLGLISCKKEGTQTTQIIEPLVKNDTIAVATIALSDGTKVISDWLELANFQSELKAVANKNITSEKELEQLINYLNKLKETIPEKFNKTAIQVRIKVIETELLMFNQYVKEQEYKLANERKNRLLKAYNLFINQLETLLIKERDYEEYH